jgi:PAS domain S-box-containing protein
VRACAVHDPPHLAARLVFTLEDRTADHSLRARLRASCESFDAVIAGLPEPILIHRRHRILQVNAAACRLLGAREPGELIGGNILECVHADSRALVSGAPSESEPDPAGTRPVKLLRVDGSVLDAEVTALSIVYRGKPAVMVVARDLTTRNRVEARLRRSEENLRQAQKMEAVGRLAGGIAHDFNNLLTAIQGHAQFLLEDLDAAIPSHADAQEIKRAADRAAALTRQLLIFSRKQVLQPTLLDVNLVVRDMEKLFRRVIREDITLETQLAPDLREIRGDPSQLEQVLMNLVVNARDAMPRGGVLTIRTRNVDFEEEADPLATLPPGRYVQIAVSDTGVGMDRETQARIFEPFFTTKPEGEGTGLGLATAYGIVTQNGGAIHVYSEPGRGTTFRILLPAATGVAVDAAGPRAELSRGWEAVLVVEDDAGIRNLTSRALQGRGYSVLEAETGAEALRLAEEYDGPIDLVITDIVMPEMSGRRLAESVHSLHPSARVLFMSGFAPEEVVRQGLVDPDARLLEKPFSTEVLARTVREVLDETG